MFDYRITFESPWYLLLLALVPVVWWYSFRGLAALGTVRRILALGLRTLVLLLFIMALSDVHMVRVSDRLTVIYLLDQSQSIPVENRRSMIHYVNAEILEHRRDDDRAGVIVFGRDAAIEIPPFDDDVQMSPLVESLLDPDFTDLSTAMRLAQAAFPEDAARRIVLVTDGNENLGDAMEEARGLSGAGVGIDVVPVRYVRRGEVILERLAIPSNVRKGQPFDLRVVATNTQQPTGESSGVVDGRLVIRKRVGGQSTVISDTEVELPPGKKVYSIRQEVDETGFYSYEAVFLPNNAEDDTMRQNNRATTFTHIQGTGQVLLIEDPDSPGQHERLIKALDKQNLEVTKRSSEQPFSTLAELQVFDTVVIANVPREHFTDAQIQMLVRNTQQLGAGLVMLGAPNGFGAGGWANTELEKAMPVDFHIKSAKVVPRGALAMLMHASEMAQGNFWQKEIAEQALNALGPRDYCGVVHYGGPGCVWLWNPGLCTVGGNRVLMVARLSRMTPGDMPDFDPGMVLAKNEFARIPDAAVKHMIVISDGDPSPPSAGVVKALIKMNVTVSTVAVGTHGLPGSRLLKKLADDTKGKYYKVTNARALPRIFQREARRVAQPLVYENPKGFRPQVRFPHEMIRGIDSALPPLTGYVLTTKKENPLVEVSLVCPQPGSERNRTLLASWTYGLGKAVAFTSDTGRRYTTQWTAWENYDKLFGQIVAWSMRPSGDEGEFTVATDIDDGQVRVVVNALDKDEEFVNFLEMAGTVVGPDLEPVQMKMEQVAPGRYVGTFPGQDSGSYFIMLSPGAGKAPIRTGIDVPYSDEFRGLNTNTNLLQELAKLVPEGSDKGGRFIPAAEGMDEIEPLLAVDTFRHDLPKATSSQDAWYYMVLLGSCFFFLDVFVRRVQVGFGWVPVVAGRVRDKVFGRAAESTEVETIQRLQNRKAEVEVQVEQLRAGTRFEVPDGTDAEIEIAELAKKPPDTAVSSTGRPSLAPADDEEEESYTSRLLRAKKRAWEQKKE
jgi:uncharacterized membrane protein/Mg-chelatase subunit ChlD